MHETKKDCLMILFIVGAGCIFYCFWSSIEYYHWWLNIGTLNNACHDGCLLKEGWWWSVFCSVYGVWCMVYGVWCMVCQLIYVAMFTGIWKSSVKVFLQRLQPMISEFILSKWSAPWHVIKKRHIPTIKDEMSLWHYVTINLNFLDRSNFVRSCRRCFATTS